MNNPFREIVNQFESLISFTYLVVASLDGKIEKDPRKLAEDYLVQKIILHASTVNHLRHGTPLNLSNHPSGMMVVDYASAIIITRAVMEIYLNLFEVFFEPQDDDVFQYRRAVYEIKGASALEKSPKKTNSTSPNTFDLVDQKLQATRDAIMQTSIYKSLDKNQQKATLNGKLYPDRNFEQRAEAAGFGAKFAGYFYMQMSSFTHGDSLSGMQFAATQTNVQAETRLGIYISLIMMILASVIQNYSDKYPEAKAICDANPDKMNLVNWLINEMRRDI